MVPLRFEPATSEDTWYIHFFSFSLCLIQVVWGQNRGGVSVKSFVGQYFLKGEKRMPKAEKVNELKGAVAVEVRAMFDTVKKRAEELGIKSIVVASTRGGTGVKVAEVFRGYNVVVVTHSTGFSGQDIQELTPKNQERILKAGGKILTTTHAFGGLGRAIRRKFDTYQSDEIVANTLRIFGQGVKVAVEIALMAADSGLISVQEDIISIGGSGRGADTALVLRPTNVQNFFDVKVHEVLCKPWL